MIYHRRSFSKLLGMLGLTAVAPALAQGKTVDVSMKNSPKAVFVPATLNIAVGDTVTWTNPG